MGFPGPHQAAGPTTHYELFSALREAGVSYLVTGSTALVLHGVPRLKPDIDLLIDPEPANVERLERALASWGYGEVGAAEAGATVRRFRHPCTALGQIDAVLLQGGEFPCLRAGAEAVTLVDLEIPIVGETDLREHKCRAGDAASREDAGALALLAEIRAGGAGSDADTGREQIRKFSRWSVAARLDWLLAAARLEKGLAPEAKPMTRGLVRRRGWYGRR